jgi:hypothetical protein
MKQAETLHGFEVPVTLSATHTDHRPITSMQFVKWVGTTWVRFGDLVAKASV